MATNRALIPSTGHRTGAISGETEPQKSAERVPRAEYCSARGCGEATLGWRERTMPKGRRHSARGARGPETLSVRRESINGVKRQQRENLGKTYMEFVLFLLSFLLFCFLQFSIGLKLVPNKKNDNNLDSSNETLT